MSVLKPYFPGEDWQPHTYTPAGVEKAEVINPWGPYPSPQIPMPKFKGPYVKGVTVVKDPMYFAIKIRIILELPSKNSYWTTKGAIEIVVTDEVLHDLIDTGFLTKFIIDRLKYQMAEEFNIYINAELEASTLNQIFEQLEFSGNKAEHYGQLSVTKPFVDQEKFEFEFQEFPPGWETDTGSRVQRELQKVLPGLFEKVICPLCGIQATLKSAIIHLNDTHRMSREDQADWVETLDIDIEFKEPENE